MQILQFFSCYTHLLYAVIKSIASDVTSRLLRLGKTIIFSSLTCPSGIRIIACTQISCSGYLGTIFTMASYSIKGCFSTRWSSEIWAPYFLDVTRSSIRTPQKPQLISRIKARQAKLIVGLLPKADYLHAIGRELSKFLKFLWWLDAAIHNMSISRARFPKYGWKLFSTPRYLLDLFRHGSMFLSTLFIVLEAFWVTQ